MPKVFAYVDDLAIFAESLSECLELIDETLTCLFRDGYIISYKKCKLFKSKMDILGITVGVG